MDISDLERIALSWIAAMNAHNAEELAVLYAVDAIHTSPNLRESKPETGGVIHGRNEIRAWEAGAFELLPTLRYELRGITPHGDRVWIDYVRKVDGKPDRFVAELLIVGDDKLILESRVYNG